MLSVAELARRIAQPTGIVTVTSRNFQKSWGNQKVSRLVLKGRHSLRSRAVRSETLVGSSAPLAPVYATAYGRAPEVTHEAVVGIDAPAQLEPPGGLVEQGAVHGKLDAGVRHAADVRRLALGEAERSDLPNRVQGVGREPVIPGSLNSQTVVEQRRVQA